MENKKQVDITQPSKNAVLAAYLNLARNNAFIVLNHINSVLGLKELIDESQLANASIMNMLESKKEDIDRQAKVVALIDESLPFVKTIFTVSRFKKDVSEQLDENDKFSSYAKILRDYLKLLNKLRNQYSHSNHKKETVEKERINEMANCFDSSVRNVKERRGLKDDEAQIEHLRAKCLNPLFRKNKGQKKSIDNPNFHYKFISQDDNISIPGVLFFTSFFLQRGEVYNMLGRITGFKRSDEEKFRLTKEAYCTYCIRIPNVRIDCKNSHNALAIDMLNELARCPKELFNCLCPKDRESFRVLPSVTGEENAEKNDILLKRSKERFTFFALSYIDENNIFQKLFFHHFLGVYRYKFYEKKYVDNSTKQLRILQQRLTGFGRQKKIEDKRKKEFSNLLKPVLQKASLNDKPFITDSYARYIDDNNRVGLYKSDFFPVFKTEDKETYRLQHPWCRLSKYELPSLLFLHILAKELDKLPTINPNRFKYSPEEIIINWCIKFESLLRKIANGKESKKEIRKMIYTKDEKTRGIAKGDKILYESDIPKEFIEYIFEKGHFARKFDKLAKEKIAKLIKECKNRIIFIQRKIERIDNSNNEHRDNRKDFGKRRFVEIKSGVIADFIARDLLYFQPTKENGKDKLTGADFQKLQSSIAYWGAIHKENSNSLLELFKNCELIKNKKNIPHPFLTEKMILQSKSITDFYIKYLRAKITYLEVILKNEEFKSHYFLRANKIKWSEHNDKYYQNLAKRYLGTTNDSKGHTIELPRGLFEDAIKGAWDDLPYDNPPITNAAKSVNTSHLIQYYFNTIRNDASQKMYNFDRNYKAVDLWLEKEQNETVKVKPMSKSCQYKKPTKPLLAKYLSIDKRADYINKSKQYMKEFSERCNNNSHEIKEEEENFVNKLRREVLNCSKNEKAIRQRKIEDIILFILAEDSINPIKKTTHSIVGKTENEHYKLKNLCFDDRKDSILSLKSDINIQLYIDDQKQNRKLERNIHKEQMMVKNNGNIMRYLKDGRLKSLLLLTEKESCDKSILLDNIEGEFNSYDKCRSSVFNTLLNFESAIINAKRLKTSSNVLIDFKTILANSSLAPNEKVKIRAIRNAFCHNEYPDKKVSFIDEKGAIAEFDYSVDDIGNIAEKLFKELESLTCKTI